MKAVLDLEQLMVTASEYAERRQKPVYSQSSVREQIMMAIVKKGMIL